MKNTKKILIRAAILLETKEWCQGAYARDCFGQPVSPMAKEATCFCAIGAINKALVEQGISTLSSLVIKNKINKRIWDFYACDLIVFNDDPYTCKEMIVQLLLETAFGE